MRAPPPSPAISLEPHLLDTLRPLAPRLPPDLAAALAPALAAPPPRTIPLALLRRIAQWARTADAPLPRPPAAYSIVALLAGTTTQPGARFPPAPAAPPAADTDMAARDRRALAALLNALLSIGGGAFAAWYAARAAGWRAEWAVLLALGAGAVVAVAEGVLYVIWQSRAAGRLRPLKLDARRKRVEAPNEAPARAHASAEPTDGELRKRLPRKERSEDS
ncbi:hypothetical protein HDZ31DRAFT_60781 [Schizophyllum fasciatum]